MYSPGEKYAWEILRGLDLQKTSKCAGIGYNDGVFAVRSFGRDVFVSPADEAIRAGDGEFGALLGRLGYFYNHVLLWWLVHARGIPKTGRLIRPTDLKGGQMFFRGTHVLPLEKLAARYARDREGFLERANNLGGTPGEFADASAELMPVEGLPMHLLLWIEDEEFPARADLLLDSSWEIAVPLDIIWSAAMLTILAMM
jgi:hypothetical protein